MAVTKTTENSAGEVVAAPAGCSTGGNVRRCSRVGDSGAVPRMSAESPRDPRTPLPGSGPEEPKARTQTPTRPGSQQHPSQLSQGHSPVCEGYTGRVQTHSGCHSIPVTVPQAPPPATPARWPDLHPPLHLAPGGAMNQWGSHSGAHRAARNKKAPPSGDLPWRMSMQHECQERPQPPARGARWAARQHLGVVTQGRVTAACPLLEPSAPADLALLPGSVPQADLCRWW